MSYRGNIALDQVIDVKFPSRQFSTGTPFLLVGGTVAAYVGNTTTPITAGITLTPNFNGLAGLNNVRVVASAANGFAAATDVDLVLSAGTVDGVSVVGEVVGSFSIHNRVVTVAAVLPGAMTAAGFATDAITATVLATSAVTEIQAGLATATAVAAVQTDVEDLQTRLPATLTGGRMRSQVEAMDANVITAAVIATDAIDADALAASAVTELQAGLATAAAVATLQADTDDIQGRLPTLLVGGKMDSHVATITANAITAAAIADNAIDRATFAVDTGLQTLRSGTAQAGAATSITLDTGASAVTNFYVNTIVVLTGGQGVGQARFITAYNGTSKLATVPAWATAPNATSTFAILPFDAIPGATAPTAAQVADAVWDEALAGHLVAGSTGAALNAAGGAGDPWITTLPGAYTAGQAGFIMGTTLDALVSTRATAAALAAVQADTDALQVQVGALPTVPAIQAGLATATALAAVQTDVDALQTGQATQATASALASVQADTDALQILVGALPTVPAIQAGLATSAALAAVQTDVDALQVGQASQATASALAAVQSDVDTLVTGQGAQATAAALASVQADTNDVQTRLPVTLVDGKMDSHVSAVAATEVAEMLRATTGLISEARLAAGGITRSGRTTTER